MDIKKIEQMGMEQGFSHVVLLDCDTIELKPEVRQMCAADTCHKYDKCWSCPPGCGSLEECEAKVRQYKYGIIVQTVGELEDAFDGEGMMETAIFLKSITSPVRPAIPAAVGASSSPITAMIAPMQAGGKMMSIQPVPVYLMISENKIKIRPKTIKPD